MSQIEKLGEICIEIGSDHSYKLKRRKEAETFLKKINEHRSIAHENDESYAKSKSQIATYRTMISKINEEIKEFNTKVDNAFSILEDDMSRIKYNYNIYEFERANKKITEKRAVNVNSEHPIPTSIYTKVDTVDEG